MVSIPQSQRQRLLVFNLRTDIDDHILGFTTRWLNELAPYYTHIDVLTTHKGRLELADNITVYSSGREQGSGRLQQLMQFYSTLTSLLLKNHYDACFAHMQPMFATLSAPLLRLRGVKITTWYTHRQLNRMVQMAEKWSFRLVTAVESSFPVASSKLRPLGHGIDTEFFIADNHPKVHPPRIVQVARLTDIKHQHILLEAVKDIDCEIVLVGDIPDGYDDAYKAQLHEQVKQSSMEDKVIFAGSQTPQEVVDWYNSATIAVNLSPVGLFDKAALESMACVVPTIVSNLAFSPVTGEYRDILHIPAPDDVASLRNQINQILALPIEEHQRIGHTLRDGIIANHSLESLVQKLISVMHTGELPE